MVGGGVAGGGDGNPGGVVGAGVEGGQRELQACLLQVLSDEEDASVRRKVCILAGIGRVKVSCFPLRFSVFLYAWYSFSLCLSRVLLRDLVVVYPPCLRLGKGIYVYTKVLHSGVSNTYQVYL